MFDDLAYVLPKVRYETHAGGEVCFEVGFWFLRWRNGVIHLYRLRLGLR